MRGVEVIVVGSGPSGLTAGFRLHQAGHRVRMLDRRPVIGGKLRSTSRAGGWTVDQGAFLFPTTHRALIRIAQEAGFGDDLGPGGFVLGTERGGQIHELDGDHLVRDFLRTPLLSRRAKLAAAKLAPVAWHARGATFDGLPALARFDTEPFARWARSAFPAEVAEFLLNTMMRSMFNASEERLTRVDFLAIISLLAGAKLRAFPEGMGHFSDRVSSRFDCEVDAEVVSVVERGDRVEVTWVGSGGSAMRTEQADGCVLAIPAAEAIRVHASLDDWRRTYMGRVHCGHSFCLNVGLSRPPAGIRAIYAMIPPSTHPFLVGIGFDHNKAPGRAPAGKGLLTLATLAEWCDERAAAGDDDAQVTTALLGALDRILPGVTGDIEWTSLSRWEQEYNPVGHYRELGRFRQACETRDRRIQLAGDYHSSQSLNSAALAGERAARLLAGALA